MFDGSNKIIQLLQSVWISISILELLKTLIHFMNIQQSSSIAIKLNVYN